MCEKCVNSKKLEIKMDKKLVTKKMKIGEILAMNEENAIILMGFGMHCCGCPMSQGETLEQACAVHGLDVDFVVDRLNNKA